LRPGWRSGSHPTGFVKTFLHRIAAAIRLWRERARSRPQLRELNDHLLRDIGLRRDDVGYEFPKPFWRWD